MYQPNTTALDPQVRGELMRVGQEFAARESFLPMVYLTAAPDKPRNGLYLFAAGVVGASRGAYRYDTSTSSYTFIA